MAKLGPQKAASSKLCSGARDINAILIWKAAETETKGNSKKPLLAKQKEVVGFF